MYLNKRRMIVFALLPMLIFIPSCLPGGNSRGTYQVNTFEFVNSRPPVNSGESVPGIWIDTNTKLSGMFGGRLKSSLPCSVMIEYTDNSRSINSAVLTSVKITYDDDSTETADEAVEMPYSIYAREYESVNSVTGGRIVKTRNWIVFGKLPNLITRDEPFRLQMEGFFARDDGSRIPFTIDEHFAVKREDTVKQAKEFLLDE